MQLAIASNTVSEADRDIMPTTGTPGWLTDGNPATGVPASGDAACNMNMIMAEIIQPILDAGLTLDATDWGQLSAAIKILIQKGITAADLVALDQIACQQGTSGYQDPGQRDPVHPDPVGDVYRRHGYRPDQRDLRMLGRYRCLMADRLFHAVHCPGRQRHGRDGIRPAGTGMDLVIERERREILGRLLHAERDNDRFIHRNRDGVRQT